MSSIDSYRNATRAVLRTAASLTVVALALAATWFVTVRTRLPLIASSVAIGIIGGAAVFFLLRVCVRQSSNRFTPPSHGPMTSARVLHGKSRGTLLAWALIAACVAALLVQSLVMGRGLVNAGLMLRVPPWSYPSADLPANRILVDQTLVFAPERERMHREFLSGRFPLWNPNLACGLPGVGSIQSGNLFPLNLLALAFSPFYASGWLAFIKLALAGGFTLLFARRLGLEAIPAAAAGVVFALGGFLVFWLNHPHVNSVMWLPLLLYLIEVRVSPRDGDARAMVQWILTAVTIGLVLLGGHPPSMIHIAFIIAGYVVARRIATKSADRLLVDGAFLFAAFLAGILIAGPQLFTYLEYFAHSSTRDASVGLERWKESFDRSVLLHYLVPYVSGGAMLNLPDLSSHLGMPGYIYGKMVYVGVVPLCLTAVAIACRTTRRRAIALTITCGAIWLIVGGLWPLPIVIRSIPVLCDMQHTRLVVVVSIALAIAAAWGVQAMPEVIASLRTRLFLAAVTVIAALVFVLVVRQYGGVLWTATDPDTAASRAFLVRQLAVFGGSVIFFALIVALPQSLGVWWRQIAVLVWIGAELIWSGHGFNPAIRRDDYYPESNAIRFVRDKVGERRLLALVGVFQPNAASAYGVLDARGVDFASVRRFEQLMTGKAGDFEFRVRVNELDRLALLPGVEYVMTYPNQPSPSERLFDRVYQGEVSVYQFRAAVPRAIVVHEAVVEPDDTKALALMRDGVINPTRAVLLDSGDASRAAGGADASDGVEWISDTPDEIKLRVSAASAGHLVLFDTWFPGWMADINGVAARVRRADYAFRAVAVPAGVSTVRWCYRPLTFSLGTVLSVMTLTVFALAGMDLFRQRRAAQAIA